MADSDNPLEAFRHALAGATRAIAGDGEVELALTSDAPRSLSLPRPDLYVVPNDAGDRIAIAVVVGVRAAPRLWVDGAELTRELRLRHDYDGWAGLWCLDLEIPAGWTPEVRAEAAAAGPYGTGEVSVTTWPEIGP